MDTYMMLLRGGKAMNEQTPEEFHQMVTKYQAWIDTLRQQGLYKSGDPLHDETKRLSGKGGANVTDGPFAESKELIGGYFLFSAESFDHAVTLAKGCPIFDNGGTAEIRQIMAVPGR